MVATTMLIMTYNFNMVGIRKKIISTHLFSRIRVLNNRSIHVCMIMQLILFNDTDD